MKKLYTTLAAVIIAACAMAQSPLSFGVRAGLNINDMRGKAADYNKGKVGFNVGAQVNYALNDAVGLQSGLLLNTRGSRYLRESGSSSSSSSSSSTTKVERETTVAIYELQLPIFLTGTANVSDDFKVKSYIGPTIGFGLSGKDHSFKDGKENEYDNDKNNIYKKPEGDDYDARFRRFNLGLAVGMGVEFKKVYFGIGYDLGLTNIINTGGKQYKDVKYPDVVKTGSLTINVGYTF